jgi:hypothetical protein
MTTIEEHTPGRPPVDPALIDECIDWIRGLRGVSFAELRRWLDGHGMETHGNWAWEAKPNLVVWAGMSEPFIDFVNALARTQRTKLRPLGSMEALLVYSTDGELLRLPIAKRVPAEGYKEPHWVPAIIDLV